MSLFEGPAHIELSEEPLAPGATICASFRDEETEILSGFHLCGFLTCPVSHSHVITAVAVFACRLQPDKFSAYALWPELESLSDYRNRLSVTHTAHSPPS